MKSTSVFYVALALLGAVVAEVRFSNIDELKSRSLRSTSARYSLHTFQLIWVDYVTRERRSDPDIDFEIHESQMLTPLKEGKGKGGPPPKDEETDEPSDAPSEEPTDSPTFLPID